ncbi:MAG: DUF2027 domain-containing protein [Bacteroidetes bacterium]|nr:DUF2027 domain-containing protein [Bacteroidota bacterium]
MKLRIGDKVRFLNEVGEGIVSRIKDKHTVFVEMNDGFEIPFLINELVPIHTELIVGEDADNIELNPEANIADAVYFVIEPDHEIPDLVSDYKIYLFNASSFNLLYSYSIKDDEYYQTLKQGEVGAYQKVLLRQVKLAFFNEYTYHKIECLLYKNSFYKLQNPIAEVLHITPRVLNEANTIKHDEFKHPVHGFLLKEEFHNAAKIEQPLTSLDIERLKTIKEFKSKSKISKSNKEYLKSLEKEVDLHIEELIDSTSGLSNFEMLNIQLERFEKELDEAITKNMKKIIFIHGVGNGRLKQEIIGRLKTTRGVTFHDASYKEYGFGATQVNIL